MTDNPVTRRTVLAALPLTGAALASNAGAAPGDPHPAWLAEWKVHYEAIGEAADDSTEQLEAASRCDELLELIAVTPAQTANGVAAQLEVLILDDPAMWDVHGTLLKTALAALRG